jgi:hypothetical protein
MRGTPGAGGTVRVVNIRRATDQDWPLIHPFYAAIMAEGRTYPFPERQTLEGAADGDLACLR